MSEKKCERCFKADGMCSECSVCHLCITGDNTKNQLHLDEIIKQRDDLHESFKVHVKELDAQKKMLNHQAELLEVAKAMRDWIDAVPDDVANVLPAMPGFDRDWSDAVMEACSPAS